MEKAHTPPTHQYAEIFKREDVRKYIEAECKRNACTIEQVIIDACRQAATFYAADAATHDYAQRPAVPLTIWLYFAHRDQLYYEAQKLGARPRELAHRFIVQGLEGIKKTEVVEVHITSKTKKSTRKKLCKSPTKETESPSNSANPTPDLSPEQQKPQT